MQIQHIDPVSTAHRLGYGFAMWMFPWLCAHLPLAIEEAVALDLEEKARPIEWVQTYEDNFPDINPPSCDG